MNGLLADKTVLITGAAAGIGRAIAVAAARHGARALVLGDVDEAGLAETAVLTGSGAVVAQGCDVRDFVAIQALVQAGEDRFGPVHAAYANAGIEGPLTKPWDYEEAAFTNLIDINVTGTWRTIKALLPRMIENGGGAIVATASVAGLVGAAPLAAYVASKHAVVGLVKSTAVAAAAAGVRVNALCPGMIETDMYRRLVAANPALEDGLMAFNPMKRLGTPEEIAEVAVWLGSDAASFVTGQALAADGGYVAQ